jgi:2-polyprenyl-3-methyl-5-hydroxy-6-metoxy-1,4-benzoquinol methylase
MNIIRKLLPYRPIKASKALWEQRYEEGHWDRIRRIDELAHYSIIVGYVEFLNSGGSILDVGCGEGILYERLCASRYSKYLGIDLSEVAVRKATLVKNNDEKTNFLATRIEDFRTDETFDVIIFNECLYYMEEPIKTLQQYESFLSCNGFFIISMCDGIESSKIWNILEKYYHIIDTVIVINSKQFRWTITVLQNHSRS